MNYNTTAGIATYLTDLDGMHRLVRDRGAAYYERKERLDQFIVLGRYWLDTCGNTMRCRFERDYREKLEWLEQGLPRVIELERVQVIPHLSITGTFEHIPKSTDRCDICSKGWALDNVTDSKLLRADEHERTFQHRECFRIDTENQYRARYTELAKGAFGDHVLVDWIPNGYGDKDGASWCSVTTLYGVVQFGWRRSVINIDWSDVLKRREATVDDLPGYDRYTARERLRAEISGEKLFADEDVTKDDTHVHAWGYEKAAAYLATLRKAFEAEGTEGTGNG